MVSPMPHTPADMYMVAARPGPKIISGYILRETKMKVLSVAMQMEVPMERICRDESSGNILLSILLPRWLSQNGTHLGRQIFNDDNKDKWNDAYGCYKCDPAHQQQRQPIDFSEKLLGAKLRKQSDPKFPDAHASHRGEQ